MILSILIAAETEDKTALKPLLDSLRAQIRYLAVDAEVLVRTGPEADSLGVKRDKLVKSAKGEYICFLGQYDLVAPNALELIARAVRNKPDGVSTNMTVTWNDGACERAYQMKEFVGRGIIEVPDVMFESRKVYFLGFTYLSPVKREIALKCLFGEEGEEQYARAIGGLIESVTFIEQPLHFVRRNRPQ